MARKGCGPYNLGAPKAVAKQIKQEDNDPKTGRVETTQSKTSRGGIKGTLTTIKTTTPGTGGVDIGVKRKTYKQFEAEGGDVEAAKAYNASIAPTPDQVDIKERFTPDSSKLTAQPIKPFKPEMPKGEPIKPLARPQVAVIQAQRGTADDPNNTLRGLSGTRSSGGSSTTRAITTSADRVRSTVEGLRNVAEQVGEKYNPSNVPDRVKKMGAEAVKKWQNKVTQRREALTPQVATSFKMRGYPNNAIGKKYKK